VADGGIFSDLIPQDDGTDSGALGGVVQRLETGGLKDPDHAVSPAGARGRNQIMPATAQQYGFDPNRLDDGAYNDQARDGILADLAKRFPGDRAAQLAGYNAGPGRAQKFVAAGDDAGALPRETQGYVQRGMSMLGNALISPAEAAPEPSGGAFADLIPAKSAAAPSTGGGAFADLIPDPNAQNFARNKQYVKPGANSFRTQLSPQDESAFQQYIADHSDKTDLGRQDDNTYDMRGWWKAMLAGDPRASTRVSPDDGLLHRNDYWKTPYHPSFSAESQWAGPNAPHWQGNKLVDGAGNVVHDDAAPNGAFAGPGLDETMPDNAKMTSDITALNGPPPAQESAWDAYVKTLGGRLAAGAKEGAGNVISMAQDMVRAGADQAKQIWEPPLDQGHATPGPLFNLETIARGGGEALDVAMRAMQTGFQVPAAVLRAESKVLAEKVHPAAGFPAGATAEVMGSIPEGFIGEGHIPMPDHGVVPSVDETPPNSELVAPKPPQPPDGGSPPPPPGGAGGLVLDPNAPKPALGPDGVPISAGGQAVTIPGGIRIGGRRGPDAGVETLIPGPEQAAPAAPEAVHDPVSWAQTGWKLPDGTVVPIDDPRAAEAQAAAAAPPADKPFTTTPGAIAAEHQAEVSALDAAGTKDADPVVKAAKAALATNIDPATGQRPKGNAALRDFRARMKAVIDSGKPSAEGSVQQNVSTVAREVQADQGLRVQPVPEAPGKGSAVLPVSSKASKAVVAAQEPSSRPADTGADQGREGSPSGDIQPLVRKKVAGDSGDAAGPTNKVGNVRGAARAIPKDSDHAAAILARSGGIRNDEGHDLVKGRGLQQMIPGAGPLIRPKGMSIDAAGETLWNQGFWGNPDSTPRPKENDVLQLLERTRRGADNKPTKVYAPERTAELEQASAGAKAEEDNATARADITKYAKSMGQDYSPEVVDQIMGSMGEHGIDHETAVNEQMERDALANHEELRQNIGHDNLEDVPFDSEAKAVQPAADGRDSGEGRGAPEGAAGSERARDYVGKTDARVTREKIAEAIKDEKWAKSGGTVIQHPEDPYTFRAMKGPNIAGQLTVGRYSDPIDVFEHVVKPAHQRKGAATAMMRAAEAVHGRIAASPALTDEGFAFRNSYRPADVAGDMRHNRDKLMGKTVSNENGEGKITSIGRGAIIATRDTGTTFVVPKPEIERLMAEKPKESFQELRDRLRTEKAARVDTIQKTFDADGRVSGYRTDAPNQKLLLTKGTEKAPFRVTSMDEHGPSGHRDYNSLEEASAEFAGKVTIDPPKKGAAPEGNSDKVIPPLKPHEGSWMVVDRKTGKAVTEIFKNDEAINRLNLEKYKAVPAGEYLGDLNKNIKAEAAAPEAERGETGLDQTIVPGTARSARQLAQAREDTGKGRIKPKSEQKDAGGMFEDKSQQTGDLNFSRRESETRKFGIPREAEPGIESYRDPAALKEHPDYKAAKGGDIKAAHRLVKDMVKPETLDDAKKRFGPDAIYAPVVAHEASGFNKIPEAMADYYADRTGASSDSEIVQSSRTFHTGAGPLDRMIARPHFDGPVKKGGKYVLVDDVSVMGGSLAELANHIREGGGDVKGVVTLANASRTGKYAIQPHVAKLVEGRFGDEVRKHFGADPSALTASEGAHLSNFKDADALRNSIAKARAARDARLRAKGLREESPDDVKFALAYHGTPHEFDEFNTDAIGTGEGNQTYGWGLYFAGEKKVADYYRNTLSRRSHGWNVEKAIDSTGISKDAAMTVSNFVHRHMDGENALTASPEDIVKRAGWADSEHRAEIEANAGKLAAAIQDAAGKRPGKTFQVDIKPKDSDFLSLDRTVEDQSPQVRDALEKVRQQLESADELDNYEEHKNADFKEWTGQEIVRQIVPRMVTDDIVPHDDGEITKAIEDGDDAKAASLYLKSLGIPGSRYLDARSRGEAKIRTVQVDGERKYEVNPGVLAPNKIKTFDTRAEALDHADSLGTHNYVLFDADHVKVEAQFAKRAEKAPAGWDAAEGAHEGANISREGRGQVRAHTRFTPEFDAKRAELTKVLQKRLNQLGLTDVALKVPDWIKAVGDNQSKEFGSYADGFYSPLKKLIAVAIDSQKGYGNAIDHESIHAMRDLGLIRDNEWAILSKKAPAWAEKYNIEKTYAPIKPEKVIEEAIAHAFPDFVAGKLGNAGGAVTRIFRRISNFFEAARNALDGLGFKSADDIFRDIDAGKIGNRERPASATEEAEPAFARRTKKEDEEEKTEPKAGIFEKLDKVTGKATEAVYHGIADAVDRLSPDSVKEAAASIRMALTPMAAGSPEARAAGKDFANGMREAKHIAGRQDDFLTKNFDAAQRQKMWEAADEESVLRQQEKTPGKNEGLNRLAPDERAAVEAFQKESNAALKEAMDIGMFKGEGLPSYMPRMVVAMGADGKANRLGYGGEGPSGLDAIGRNLKTTSSNLRERKYLTTEETEAAAQNIDPNAMVVKDIRTLPLAMGRLREAIAGRRLINQIREDGRNSGETTVAEGEEPQDDHKWFTIDHPAFKTYRVKVARDKNGQVEMDGNKVKIEKDENGDPIFEKVPLFVRSDYEGPLRAVLSQDMPKVMKALMTLKGKTMSVIMYSPLMHNAVIWGKAFPNSPIKMLNPLWKDASGQWHVSLEMYGRGRQAKNDPVIMKEAIRNGLDPIGHRFGITDATGLVDEPNLKPGRSWTAQALGYVPGLFDKDMGDHVKRAIDKMGDVWHNKMLWDLVGDLQMGLYTHMRDIAVKHGADDQTAGRYAAHFANRYAGALPIEAMSKGARMWANALMFSRSFTMTNLGAFKDLTNGLPKDVQAQILRDKGIPALERIQGTARRKAASLLVADIALSHIGTVLAAGAVAWLAGNAYQSPSDNEPDKKNRFLIRYDKDGTAIYGRAPVGKVGEDLQDWVLSPNALIKKKLSPFGHAAYGLISNDKGFGQKIYDPYDTTATGYFKNLARIAEFTFDSMLPVGPFEALHEMGKPGSKGDATTKAMQLTLPLMGVTVSKGAPGGPAMGQLYASKDEHEFQVGEHLPEIKEKIRSGDIKGAAAEMDDLGISRSYQKFLVRTTQNPGAKLTKRQMNDFLGYATPDEQQKMKGFISDEKGRRDQHSDLEPGDLKGALKSGDLTRFAAAGATWTRQEAISAAAGAGLSATAAALRDMAGPVHGGQAQKSVGEFAAG
jgi:hypothetical protein